jgi:hypothetical protein
VFYQGSVGALPSLLVGFGGGPFEQCVFGGGAGTIENLELALPDDPERCPAGKARCGAGAEQASCVDTARSGEHCGGCGRACAPNEICAGGVCRCGGRPGVVECGGACVDTLTSPEHCGRCGNACAKQCVSGQCDRVAGDCTSQFELDPAGGTLPLDFAPVYGSYHLLCERWVVGPFVARWTPQTSGIAKIEVDVGTSPLDSLIGITEDLGCRNWTTCNDDVLDLGLGSRVEFAVKAGTTYLIGVGLVRQGRQITDLVELRVGLLP